MTVWGDVDYFNSSGDFDVVIIEITRECIEQCYVASTLEKLYAITDTPARIIRYRDNMLFSVGGYDDDPRELYEIPEVCVFFRTLTASWPYWVWFLNHQSGLLVTLMTMLCGYTEVKAPGGGYAKNIDPTKFANVLEDLLRRSNPMFVTNEISQADMQASLTQALVPFGMPSADSE